MSEVSADPLVTVYITTFNRVDLLKRALDSVISQTYRNIEVFVVDDNSTDSTCEAMAGFRKRYDSVYYLRNAKNMGACYSRNRAINQARGKFITGLDDDDEFTADRIEKFVAEYDANHSFLCANVIVKAGNKTIVNYEGMEIDRSSILYENYVNNQVFVETERFRKLGGFDVGLSACQDYDMWIRLILEYGPARRLPVATYIVYEDVQIKRISVSPKAFKGYARVYRKYKPLMNKQQRVNRLVYVRRVQGKTVSSRIPFFIKYLGAIKTLRYVLRENSSKAYLGLNFLRTLRRRLGL